ncbi:serine/threonine-protein kinase [Nocardia coubleae]|uniref:non-specific serine/threonine protein kinase n=1 Tax=Nocardia coubleae TaxID=356147 RepID=A0A846W6H8_9NOCA|nr:serine/threonine-protein kinase [Nocardia coubleae]NKX88314.1 protein kinase [Nocardia coubleae]
MPGSIVLASGTGIELGVVVGEIVDGRYEITGVLGAGGMGEVLAGYDTVLDRPVAVKRIAVRQFASRADLVDEFVARFRREARVTARIRHHGVPQVFDAVLDAQADSVYLVMEHIDGVTLRDYLAEIGELPVGWAVAIATQIATVLSYAHVLPVVHRDLKPANIVVAQDGTVKVIDFGIAALLDGSTGRITRTGSVLGTAAYMPPELVNGQEAGPRADLYALGCVMHEMFSGRRVFEARSEFDTHNRHLSDPPTPLRALRRDVPAPIEQLVLELLAKDPAQRPSSAQLVYERLLPFLPAPGAPEDPASRTHPDPTRLFRRPNPPADAVVEPLPPKPSHELPAATGLSEAAARYRELFALGRAAQAADVLLGVVDQAEQRFGPDSPQLGDLHRDIATALEHSGEQRRALAQWQRVEAIEEPTGTRGRRARVAAIGCRAALGELTAAAAVDELYRMLGEIRSADNEFGDDALLVRLALAEHLPAAGDHARAARFVARLRDDLAVLRPPDDPMRRKIEALAAELRC